MTTSRLAVGAAAALFSALLSIDPSVRASDASPSASIAADPIAAEPTAAEAGITPIDTAAPADMTLEISPEGGRSQRVVVHRPGYLVALLHGAARSAGKDWAALRVQIAEPSAKRRATEPGAEIDRLVWESTRLGTFVTERGLVSLSLSNDGSGLAGRLALAAPPTPAGETRTAHARCVAHHDGAGGFTALCRLDHAARRINAANVTGLRVIEGAVVAAEKKLDPLVRLDLPLAPGVGEGRVVGFTLGRTGHALRVEASWAPGEEPALFFAETERVQPQAP